MATTDFLLKPTAQPTRVQSTVADAASQQRSPQSTPANSFSSVYAQQQRNAEVKQQQSLQAKQRNDAILQDKQQAARQAAAKNTPAVKDKPAVAAKDRTDTKDTRSTVDQAAAAPEQDRVKPAADTEQNPSAQQAGEALEQNPQEEDLIDPLLLMAMAAVPVEMATQISTEAVEAGVDVLANQGKASLNLSLDSDEAEPELLEDEDVVVGLKTIEKIDTAIPADKAALVSATAGKNSENFAEKVAAEKSTVAAMSETVKAAPDTLLNNKAVTPTDTIRADMQPRQESLLAAQQVRQVPGAPIAMQQPGWTQEVTDRVMWMSAQNLKSAEIKLDPAELGRLDIKVDMSQEQTQVTFASANAGVRDSLESQMFRLRELLAQQGLQNVDVNVSDQSQQQAESQAQASARSGGNGTQSGQNDEDVQQQMTPLRQQEDGRSGLVDYYA